MGKLSAVKGGLGKLAAWMEESTPELRATIMDLTHNFLDDPATLSNLDRKTLLDYLRGVGSKQEWKDAFPGHTPTRMGEPVPPLQIDAPRQGERWLRGATPRARLPENSPIFSTRQPEGAAWYATERSGNPHMMGSITEYLVNAKNPARQRDLIDILATDPKLAAEASAASPDPYNVWDRIYHPDIRKAMQKRGFDAALGHDVLERGDIEALIALDKGQMQPVQRRLVVPDGSGILDKVNAPLYEFDDAGNYVQIGRPRPFTKKAKGGLVQMKECGCK